jgi:hypothetical protein
VLYLQFRSLTIAFCRGFSALMTGAMRLLTTHLEYDAALSISGLGDYFKGFYVEGESDLYHIYETLCCGQLTVTLA